MTGRLISQANLTPFHQGVRIRLFVRRNWLKFSERSHSGHTKASPPPDNYSVVFGTFGTEVGEIIVRHADAGFESAAPVDQH